MSHPDPPWSGWISTTGDALLILEAARRGLIPRVTRRLVDAERKMICSGSVFVFDEEESGIKRWTDGYFWSPSRILGNFMLYRETGPRGGRKRKDKDKEQPPVEEQYEYPSQDYDSSLGRSLVGSLSAHTANSTSSNAPTFHFKPDGLMKKTFSLTINGVSQHLISYYKPSDVTTGRLRSPSSLPELACLDISAEYLDKTHFRIPPKVEVGTDGIPRYRGDADEEELLNKDGPSNTGGIKVVKERQPQGLLSGPVLVTAKRPHSDDELETPPDKRQKGNASSEPVTQTPVAALASVSVPSPAPAPATHAMIPIHYPIVHPHTPPAPSQSPPQYAPPLHPHYVPPPHPQYAPHAYYGYPVAYSHPPHPPALPVASTNQAMHPYPPYYPIYAWQHPLPPQQQPEASSGARIND